MEQKIKAIFFDVDGTLVRFDTHQVPDSTREALNILHEKGVRLFVASGRPPHFMQIAAGQLEGLPFDGFILSNGQYCTDAYLTPFYAQALPRRAFEGLIPWLEENPDVVVSFVERDYCYLNRITPEYMQKRKRNVFDIDPVEDPRRALEHTTDQINPFLSAAREKELLAHMPGVKSVRWNDIFSDIIPADGGKDVGIQRMLDRFGIDREETMAFGDGGNDISMLQFCKIGVAMGNATDNVKETADYVTDDIAQDGLSKALAHFELI